MRAASRLFSTPRLRREKRRQECRRGTHECVRHELGTGELIESAGRTQPNGPFFEVNGYLREITHRNRFARTGIQDNRGSEMNIRFVTAGMMALALAGVPAAFGSNPDATATQMVITALPVPGVGQPQVMEVNDVAVTRGKTPARVLTLEHLTGDLADMQLFVLLDDSTRSASLGVQLGELKTFLNSLPASTEVAVGYMRNGSAVLAQSFTTDHQKAAGSLRLPEAVPGVNGSPYFALSELVKHWPSKESTHRRTVLMLTDGVDPYYGNAIFDDPYVDTAMHDALKSGVTVYSIYLRGAGLYGHGSWITTMAQSRLSEVSQQTGGYAYFQGISDPVSIAPFLTNFEDRMGHQYRLTIESQNPKGVQPVKVRTELPALKLDAPTYIYVR